MSGIANSLGMIIQRLIESKKEGDFYDFKKQWHFECEKLVHDIICMANVITHEGERYIIFGINDDYMIEGIENDQNRKNQQNVIDLLKNYDFNGDYRPNIRIQTIVLENKHIDVLIISDKPYKPYFLRKVTGCKRISTGIYTRVGDTNTPIDSSADYNFVEKMFEERFGLNKSPLERIKLYLLDHDNWNEVYHVDNEDIIQYYYNKMPEFTIRYWMNGQESVKWDERDITGQKFDNHIIEFMYYSTILFRGFIKVSKDGRFCFVLPRYSKSFYHNSIPYFIYIDYVNFIMNNSKEFINKIYGISLGHHQFETKYYNFIYFENEHEKELFCTKENQKRVFELFLEDKSMEKPDNNGTQENHNREREFRAFIYEYYQNWKKGIENEI